jgi:hypothetical protein
MTTVRNVSVFQLRALKMIVKLATLELKLASVARALERNYRVDQPRAPSGTPIGGQWIDERVDVAARRVPRVRCVSCGGASGSSGMYDIRGTMLCPECTVKILNLQGKPYRVQIEVIKQYDPLYRDENE